MCALPFGNRAPLLGHAELIPIPDFSREAISCERCHGPVERRLADPPAGTIINPAKLEPAARDSVCEHCHLFGAARVPNPGKRLGDFIPGQRLEDTFTIYRSGVPPGASAGAFKVTTHVSLLSQAMSTATIFDQGQALA
jgi:hypothetical protein